MIDNIIKFKKTSIARGIAGGVAGGLFVYTILYTLTQLFVWFMTKSGATEPAWAATVQGAVLVLGVVWAFGSSIVSSSGSFNHTKVGAFFYYLGGTALAWGMMGQALTMGIFWVLMRNVKTYREISEGLPASGEAGLVIGAIFGVPMFLVFAGVLTGWIKNAMGMPSHIHHGAPEGEPEWMRYFSVDVNHNCLLYTSPSPRDLSTSRMPSSA